GASLASRAGGGHGSSWSIGQCYRAESYMGERLSALRGSIERRLNAGVTVQAAYPEVHGEVGEHDQPVHQNEPPHRVWAPAAANALGDHMTDAGSARNTASPRACVEVGRDTEPGDERAGLFRVPPPVAAPGAVRPPGAQGDPEAKQRKTDDDGLVREIRSRL